MLKIFLYIVILTLSPTLTLGAFWLGSNSPGKAEKLAWWKCLQIEW